MDWRIRGFFCTFATPKQSSATQIKDWIILLWKGKSRSKGIVSKKVRIFALGKRRATCRFHTKVALPSSVYRNLPKSHCQHDEKPVPYYLTNVLGESRWTYPPSIVLGLKSLLARSGKTSIRSDQDLGSMLSLCVTPHSRDTHNTPPWQVAEHEKLRKICK